MVLWGGTACSSARQEGPESGAVTRDDAGVDAELEALRTEGAAYNSAGMFVEGELRWGKALSLLRARSSREASQMVEVLSGLALSYRGEGRPAQARAAAVEALRLVEPGSAEGDAQIWRLERGIGASYAAEGRPTLAIASHRQALEAAARHMRQLRANVIESQMSLSVVLLSGGDAASATSSAEEAWQMARQGGQADRVLQHDTILNLIATYVKVGRWEDAQRLLGEERGIVRIWRPRYPEPENAPLDEEVLRPRARGRLVGSGKIAVRLSDAWAYCAYKFAGAQGTSSRTARLTALLGRDGGVSEVTLTAFGLSTEAADCMVLEAAATRFPSPEGEGALLTFATETFP